MRVDFSSLVLRWRFNLVFLSIVSVLLTFHCSLSLSRRQCCKVNLLPSLSGCRLHSPACQIQPWPVGCLSVHSWRTEVRHTRKQDWVLKTYGDVLLKTYLYCLFESSFLQIKQWLHSIQWFYWEMTTSQFSFISNWSVRVHSSCLLVLIKHPFSYW